MLPEAHVELVNISTGQKLAEDLVVHNRGLALVLGNISFGGHVDRVLG